MKDKSVNPLTRVVNPEILTTHIKKCCEGEDKSRSYVRGALQYLERKPPNPFIVPLLKKALARFNEQYQRTQT